MNINCCTLSVTYFPSSLTWRCMWCRRLMHGRLILPGSAQKWQRRGRHRSVSSFFFYKCLLLRWHISLTSYFNRVWVLTKVVQCNHFWCLWINTFRSVWIHILWIHTLRSMNPHTIVCESTYSGFDSMPAKPGVVCLGKQHELVVCGGREATV